MSYNYDKCFKIYLILFNCYQIVLKKIWIFVTIFIYDVIKVFQKFLEIFE